MYPTAPGLPKIIREGDITSALFVSDAERGQGYKNVQPVIYSTNLLLDILF